MTEAIHPPATHTASYPTEIDAHYDEVLRQVATARLRARRLAGTALANDWHPTPEHLLALNNPVADQIAEYLEIAGRLAIFTSDLAASRLRKEQREPFQLMAEFIGRNHFADSQAIRSALKEVLQGGIAKLPPGSGKTVLASILCAAAGIGEPKIHKPIQKRRAVFLTSTIRLEEQAMGTEDAATDPNGSSEDEQTQRAITRNLQGFAGLAPGLKVGRFEQPNPERSDVDIMTYTRYTQLIKNGILPPDAYHIIIADEGHHMLGEQTRLAVDQARRVGRARILALTATDKYHTTRTLSEFIPNYVCKLDFREEIDAGNLPPVQLLRVLGNEKGIEVKDRRSLDYTAGELRMLAHDNERNESILSWVEYLVSQGRRVMVPCSPGDECWHAKHLAGLANGREIVGSQTGEVRAMKAIAVSSYLTADEVDQILGGWDRGAYDAIFQVNMLGEGWNTRVDAIVEACPTASFLVAEQRLGRLARFAGILPKVYVTITDTMRSNHKPQVTPWHVLGEEAIDQGKIIGKPDENRCKTNADDTGKYGDRGPGAINIDMLPDKLAKNLGPRYVLVQEALIAAMELNQHNPADTGWVVLRHYESLWPSGSLHTVVNLLRRNGFEAKKLGDTSGREKIYVPAAAISFLEAHEPPPLAPPDHKTLHGVSTEINVGPTVIEALTQELGLETTAYYVPQMCDYLPHYTPGQIKLIKDRYEKQRAKEGQHIGVTVLARELKIQIRRLQAQMATHKPPIIAEERTMPSGQKGWTLTQAEADLMRIEIKRTTVTYANKRLTIAQLAHLLDVTDTSVKKFARELGMELKKGQHFSPSAKRSFGVMFMERPAANQVMESRGWYLVDGAHSHIPCNPYVFSLLLTSINPGIIRSVQMDDTHWVGAIHQNDLELIKARCQKIQHVADWPSHAAIAQALSTTYDELLAFIQKYALVDNTERKLGADRRGTYAIDVVYNPTCTKRIIKRYRSV